jgi:hypothetical protein
MSEENIDCTEPSNASQRKCLIDSGLSEAKADKVINAETAFSQKGGAAFDKIKECTRRVFNNQDKILIFWSAWKALVDETGLLGKIGNSRVIAAVGTKQTIANNPALAWLGKTDGVTVLPGSTWYQEQGTWDNNKSTALFYGLVQEHLAGFGKPIDHALATGGTNATAAAHGDSHRFAHWFRTDDGAVNPGWHAARRGEHSHGRNHAGQMGNFSGNVFDYWVVPRTLDRWGVRDPNDPEWDKKQADMSQAERDAGYDEIEAFIVQSLYPRGFYAQMGASTSALANPGAGTGAFMEQVKLSFTYPNAGETYGDFDTTLYNRAIKDRDKEVYNQLGARTWVNGTFRQAWDLFLQNLQQSHPDLVPKFRALDGIRNFQQVLISMSNDWECIRLAGKDFLMAQKAYEKVILEVYGEKAGFWSRGKKRMGNIVRGHGRFNNNMERLIKASMDFGAVVQKDRQRTIFNEQCFLLSYVGKISAHKKALDVGETPATQTQPSQPPTGTPPASAPSGSTSPTTPSAPKKPLPYEAVTAPLVKQNASLLLDGDPYGFLNKLVQHRDTRTFFNMPSSVLNNLQPLIRLYKVEYGKNHKPYETEFRFDSNSSNVVASLMRRGQRGAGVGIKSFNFTYDGDNPFAVKKSIKATLKIFANSMDDLLRDISLPGQRELSYADLALKTRTPTASRDECATDPDNRRRALQDANLDKLNFRLKAIVGWAPPNGNGPWTQLSNLSEDENRNRLSLLNGIYSSYTTLNLVPTVHNFDFDEMGRVTFTINYLAYVEEYYDTPAYNVFAGAATGEGAGAVNVTANQIKRNLQLDWYSRNCKETAGGDGDKTVNNVRENLTQQANEEKTATLQALLENLQTRQKIYFIRVKKEQVNFFNSQGPYYNWGEDNTFKIFGGTEANSAAVRAEMTAAFNSYDWSATEQAADGNEQKLFKASLTAGSPDNYAISYFYISDLVDSILASIGGELDTLETELENVLSPLTDVTDCQKRMEIDKIPRAKESFKKLRILLGPVEFVNQGKVNDGVYSGISQFVNFGDIPISVRFFMEWLTAQMLEKDRTTYTLTRFLNDLFNKLIRDFLNDGTCFSWDIKQRVRVNQSTLTSYTASGVTDSITTNLKNAGKTRAPISTLSSPILNTAGPRARDRRPAGTVGQEFNYFVYFAGRTAPTELMKGNKRQDERRGIFHYMLGRDRGLIKNIKLTKTDSKGLAEVRFEQEGYDGLTQLRVVYDVEIDSFADVKTYPGTYIYVEPRGFAPGSNIEDGNKFNLTRYGIGGYFMIVKSTHNFAAGEATSTISAKWVNAVEAQAQAQVDAQAESGNQSSPSRCATGLAVRSAQASESELSEP